MNDALVLADDMAVEIDDLPRRNRGRLQAPDAIGIASARNETDVLAVLLVCDLEAETPRQGAYLQLGHVAERKAQIVELLARGREQEISRIAMGIGGAQQRP